MYVHTRVCKCVKHMYVCKMSYMVKILEEKTKTEKGIKMQNRSGRDWGGRNSFKGCQGKMS